MMKSHPFLARLEQGVLLADGAMGTLLYARGVAFDQCFDELNLSRPEVVRQIHLDYIASGAELIETNTFGANRFKLGQHNLAHRMAEISHAGAALAREAAGTANRHVFVVGSMGPIGRPMAPLGAITPEDVRSAYAEQATALVDGGADVLILETFTDLNELLEAVRGVQSVTAVPLIAQMTFTQEGKTMLGHEPREIVRALEQMDVEVIGANCSVGSQGILEVLQQMAASVTRARLSAMPNAGFPAYVGGRYIYFSNPTYMAGYAAQLAAVGVRVIGGCCGTTPEHIAAMRRALAEPVEHAVGLTIPADLRSSRPAEPEPVARPQAPTPFAQKLGRSFVITVEIDPPQMGDYPNATAVSDVKPSGLVRLIKKFNQGYDVAGNAIGTPTGFTVGVALNLAAPDLDKEARILERKVAAGADFICTMPIYEPEALDRFERIMGGLPVPALLGVLPLVSHRHAEFLHNELPGFAIPAWVRERMHQATDARQEGIRVAVQLMEAVRLRVGGVYLVPSFGRYDGVLELVRLARQPAKT